MNTKNLSQIFQHYIEKFEYVNGTEHEEYYKWQVCYEFPVLMKTALGASDDEFSKALYNVKKCTFNIIDSYTQPFMGLVEFAKDEPGTVRRMFTDLYADDGGDIKVQMEKIADFFNRSNELLDKYSPGSFLYKQNSHSVSALQFLNDPDHHYMYKATQSQRFADCVEFYDDWGTGDNIKLDVYYRMCDELISEIKNTPELLATDAGRFDGRLKISGGELHPDTEKHILAFDIIYCCTVYNLFDGISFTKKNMKEKQLYLAEKAKAESLKKDFDKAKGDMDALQNALEYFVDAISVGDEVTHTKYGKGMVKTINDRHLVADFPEKEAKLSLAAGIANNIISLDKPGFKEKAGEYRDVLIRYESIPRALDYASRALEPYEEYLE